MRAYEDGMLDYKGIQALYQVVRTQSFEMAADKLFVTQSAVSQRIKGLEQYYGCPLLSRSLPYEPTELGSQLISHYQQLKDLEENLLLQMDAMKKTPKISVAINRDSLETWFREVMQKLKTIKDFRIEIISDDQDVTIDYMRKGLVSAALSTAKNPLPGCKVEFLGYMMYVLVSSPEFKKRYFDGHKSIAKKLLSAPTVIFDSKDSLHENYLKDCFNITDQVQTFHTVPSVYVFKEFTLKGYGYALIPEIDIRDELKNGSLIDLFPKKHWPMPLYWHTRAIQTPSYQQFNDIVRKVASDNLID